MLSMMSLDDLLQERSSGDPGAGGDGSSTSIGGGGDASANASL